MPIITKFGQKVVQTLLRQVLQKKVCDDLSSRTTFYLMRSHVLSSFLSDSDRPNVSLTVSEEVHL